MSRYKNKPFFGLFIRFTITFFIIVMLFKIISAWMSGGTPKVQENLLRFTKLYGVMALIYGVFMAGYYKFIQK